MMLWRQLLIATALSFPALLCAQSSDWRGGDLWIELSSGWRWSPDAAGLTGAVAGDESPVRLRRGEYWIVNRGDCDAFRVRASSAGFDLYAWQRCTPPLFEDDPDALPVAVPLAAIELPVRRLDAEGNVFGAELEPEALGDWIAVRCSGESLEVTLEGHRRYLPAESWERLERAVRLAVDPRTPWPLTDESAADLPGRHVEAFLRRLDRLFPWPPTQDTEASRALRVAAFLLERESVRPLVRGRIERRRWPLVTERSTVDDQLVRWNLIEGRVVREVTGPTTLRVRARGMWPDGRFSEGTRSLCYTVSVGAERREVIAVAGLDVAASTKLWADDARSANANAFLSRSRETRIVIPPGVHRVVVDPGAGELGEGQRLPLAIPRDPHRDSTGRAPRRRRPGGG